MQELLKARPWGRGTGAFYDLKHWGLDKMAAILQTTFWSSFLSMKICGFWSKISLKFVMAWCQANIDKPQWVNSLWPSNAIDLGQHWFRYWLVAWWYQAITWNNVDLLLARSCNIHGMSISWAIPQPSITKIILKIIDLKFYLNFRGTSELT